MSADEASIGAGSATGKAAKCVLRSKRFRETVGSGFAVTAEKYDPIRKAILAAVPRDREGVTLKELVAAVTRKVPKPLFPKPGSVAWYTKVVQLELEAQGLIARIAGVTPQRVRRVK